MKLTIATIFVLLSFNINLNAQITKENYKFSNDIENYMEKDTVPWRFQYGATYYSINGNYKKALQTWDKTMSTVPSITAEDSSYFKQFKPYYAKDYILKRSKNEKLIIINEAHNNSRHRVFTTSLLKGLYKNGYRFLGMEMLDDTLINQRKFPVLAGGSIYIHESQSANLIKDALDIGFTLFNYEYFGKGKTGKDREIGEAENIAKIMTQNPNAKFLIHCGYDHLNEGIPGIKEWEKAMASRVHDLTGINPFTIDQIPGSEKGDLKFNTPFIKMANIKTPSIMVNAQGESYNGKQSNKRGDCSIIYPVSTYTNERPDWLTLDGQRKIFDIPVNSITEFPVLVMAYRNNELEQNGIPADIIEINSREQKASLILDKGDYQIIVKNKEYKIIQDYQQKIK
ncbi:hypothetical protein [Flavobacterium aquicola]|uniref:Uncharacterized protein n=1 Tax=Flavobacterium aquicola TaxID=1682742 RepID=A0A3E0EJJ4_9FLAO|nr:hypothetical protein [Flavobacterium aquicola]REG97890.1 hypothetical protein C8P67_10853 [Flavobacterium aquicola]